MTGARSVMVLLAAAAFVSSPAVFGGFGGFDPEAFPVPQEDPPIEPAGYAFSIWGIIYAWLLVHATWGALTARRHDPVWDATRTPLIASLGVGAAWIPVAKASPLWATVLIFVMLAGALAALRHARNGANWMLAGPLGVYAGWLTAASLVSLGVTAAGFGIGPAAAGWAWIGLAGALLISVTVQLLTRVPFYGLAVAWALAAIAVRNWGSDAGLSGSAAGGCVALLLLAGWTSVQRHEAASNGAE